MNLNFFKAETLYSFCNRETILAFFLCFHYFPIFIPFHNLLLPLFFLLHSSYLLPSCLSPFPSYLFLFSFFPPHLFSNVFSSSLYFLNFYILLLSTDFAAKIIRRNNLKLNKQKLNKKVDLILL